MIQDIAPHTYHNEYKPVAPDKESHILAYEEGKILMKKDGETMTLPSFGELEGKVENLYENYIYLFSVPELSAFASVFSAFFVSSEASALSASVFPSSATGASSSGRV